MEAPKNIHSKISEMLSSLHQLGLLYLTRQYHNVIFYAKKCGDIAKETGHKEFEMISYKMMALSYDAITRPEDAIRYSRMCLDIVLKHPELMSIEDAEMASYMVLGSTHKFMKKYDEAFVYGMVSLNLAREYGDEHCEMKVIMLLGAVCERLKRFEDAILYTNKSIKLARQLQDPYVEMQAHFILGLIYYNLQKYEEAAKHNELCIAMGRENNDRTFEKRARLLLVFVYDRLEKYENEISNALACIDLAKESTDPPHLELELYFMLAQANYLVDRFDNALDFGKRCLSMVQELGLKSREFGAFNLLGRVYTALAQPNKAKSCINKALDIARETGDKANEECALRTLGEAYFVFEKWDLAISCFNESKAVAQEIGSEVLVHRNSFWIKTAHHFQSIVKSGLSCIEETLVKSEETQNKDGSINEHIFVFEHFLSVVPDEEIYYRSLGKTSQFSEIDCDDPETWGKHFEMLTDLTQANLCILKQNYAQFSRRFLSLITKNKVLFNILLELCITSFNASMLMSEKQYDKALKSFETLPSLTKKRYQKIGEAFCFFQIGSIHQILGQKGEAEKSYRQAVEILEGVFDRLYMNDALKITFLNTYDKYYKSLSDLLIQSNRKEEAFLMLERCRARVLKDTLAVNYRMKREKLNKLKQMDMSVVHSLVSKTNYSIILYSLVLKELYTFVVDTDGLHFFSQSAKDCEIIDEALKELTVHEPDRCEDRSLEYLKSQNSRDGDEEAETRIRSERFAYEEPLRDEDESNLNDVLRDLHHKLLGQVMAHRVKDEIIIVTDGPIAKVPFAALLDPETGQYLSETKKIRYAPSITTLTMIQERPVDETSNAHPLIIGSPLVGKVMMNGEEQDIEPLFGALDEAIDIAALLGVSPLVAANATKPAVLERLQERVSVVHIAAHGILSKATIVLAPSPEIRETKIPDEEDYMLTMADVQQAKVRAQLVVLSCCHSGRGKIRSEGVVGMCRAFLASGARAVVASLWAIDDEATLEFMKIFYGHLKNGKSASTSLQLTMNEMKNTAHYKEPKYWAPFFLMGDDVTLQL